MCGLYWTCVNWQGIELWSFDCDQSDVPVEDSTDRTNCSGLTSCGCAVFVRVWSGFFLCPLFIIYIHTSIVMRCLGNLCTVLLTRRAGTQFSTAVAKAPPPHSTTPSVTTAQPAAQPTPRATNWHQTPHSLSFSPLLSLPLFPLSLSPVLSYLSLSLIYTCISYSHHTAMSAQGHLKVTSILIFYSGWRHKESNMMCWSCLLPTGIVVIRTQDLTPSSWKHEIWKVCDIRLSQSMWLDEL